MEPAIPIQTKVFQPFGSKLKQENPWLPQEVCGEWPHQASALSLGESNVLKFGVSFPLRTGLDCPEESDFPENVSYLASPAGKLDCGVHRKVEEMFLSRGSCVVSEGPLGGPCNIKGLYRPLSSYGSGTGIKSVVKTNFPRDNTDNELEKDSYICLVEKGGISLYAEGKSETHVAYMPEFQIDYVTSCSFGLLVIPTKNVIPETDDSKYLYILTHPIKQVSRLWGRNQPGSDFHEFDTAAEKLLWCEKDLCVFWSVNNDKLVLRRLVHLERKDIIHSSTLSASLYYTNQETSNSPFSPAGGSSMYSPFGKIPPKTSVMRVNREGTTVYYWPTFDFSDTSGLSVGFYPPHYCVYDDPEFFLSLLFEIQLNPNGKWKYPKKFQVVTNNRQPDIVAMWYLINTTLYLHSINISNGSKIAHYAIKGVEDFTCSDGKSDINTIALLTIDNHIKLGFLDQNFAVVASSKLTHDIDKTISSLDNFLFSDTLICSLKDTSVEKAMIVTKNIRSSCLISKCFDQLAGVLPTSAVSKLVANYICGRVNQNFSQEWTDFISIVKDLLVCEYEENPRNSLGMKIYHAIEDLRENLKVRGSSQDFVDRLSLLSNTILTYSKDNFPNESIPTDKVPVFQKFLQLLLNQNPTEHPDFEKLPGIMQILLDKPDTLESMKKLTELKAKENSFAPVLELLITDIFQRNQNKVQFNWPESVIKNIGRVDYLSGTPNASYEQTSSVFEVYSPFREKEDGDEESTWTSHVLNLRVFSEDRRLEEVCRLLDSASPLTIDIEQRAEMSDHEFVEEQEKHLLQILQVTFSAPVGRAAFTLKTEIKSFSNLTNVIHLPRLCLSGKCATRGTTIELNDSDSTNSFWPTFHNAVASSISVRFSDQPADAWFAYNKAKTTEGPEQAGMVLGFGLNRILNSMPPTLRHEYLARENSFTSMAMLLGLSANLAGTGDIATWKVISLHIGAMLPACTTELEIPRLATLVAPCALGLLFMGTQNTHIAKVLLGEISKRYNPLSIFGGFNNNNSANNANAVESNGLIADREAHSLCAGFGLGFVNLGKCRLGNGAMDEDGFDGILRRFVVGGPKPQTFNDEEEEMYNQYGQTLPSLWEEYRCCHIEEGDNVNVDVTTPSAIVAVALTYLRSGNEAVLKWLSPPTTLHLLDGVRPDLLMLRTLASILVYEDIEDMSIDWLETTLMPSALGKTALKKPVDFSRFDHESINQAWASIVCGYCLGLGIRFAGTSDRDVVETLWHYIDLFLNIIGPESTINEYFPKNFLESSICNILIALSLVLAGTGDIPVLRLCRYMQSKIAATQITTSSNTYGMEMCVSMATGILFLGGGRYSLSNDDQSIAVLLASVFPKWPINVNDNRYHLQALRHLYVLAAQPRLILPQPMPHRSKLIFFIEYLDGQIVETHAPVLLPPFYLLKKISLQNKEYLPLEFNLPEDLFYLKRIVEGNGVITLVQKPVAVMTCNFMKQMAWRDARVFHSTFADDADIPPDESYEIKELNLISRMAETASLRNVVPALMALKNGDPSKEDWVLQLRILYWWITNSSCQTKSCIPVELLGLFLNKAGNDFKILFPNVD